MRPAAPIHSATLLALGLVLLAAGAALAVSLAGAEGARAWLGYGFEGLPDRAGEVVAIFANNVRMLAGVFAACCVAQLARNDLRAGAGPQAALASGFGQAFTWVCDLAVAGSAVGHALLIGASVGAYGNRLLAFLFPHGPFELAAYSIALALYVEARRGRVPLRRWVASAALGVGALALGAPLEVFLAP